MVQTTKGVPVVVGGCPGPLALLRSWRAGFRRLGAVGVGAGRSLVVWPVLWAVGCGLWSGTRPPSWNIRNVPRQAHEPLGAESSQVRAPQLHRDRSRFLPHSARRGGLPVLLHIKLDSPWD